MKKSKNQRKRERTNSETNWDGLKTTLTLQYLFIHLRKLMIKSKTQVLGETRQLIRLLKKELRSVTRNYMTADKACKK